MSSRSLGTLTIDIVAKTGLLEQGMERAARKADSEMRKIERSAKTIGAAIGVGIGALAVGIGAVVRNTMEAQKTIGQLDAILASTGNAAGYTRDQLVSMAQQFQDESTFGRNEIIEAQTRLLSYSGVLGENIPRAMQAIIDQSARLGMSVSQSAETIGRALESPAKAAAALAQQGFGAAFTKEVRGTIDALVAAGREGEAQVMVLEIMEESYKGAAAAMRDTLGGALTALKHNLTTLLTGGEGTLSGLTKAVNDLNDALSDQAFRRGVADITSGVLEISTSLTRAIPSIVAFGREFGTMVRQMGIDAAFLVEAGSAAAQGWKQILTLGIADGTWNEADAQWKRSFQTRRELIAESQRDLDRYKADARARAGLANLTYVDYKGPLLEGMDRVRRMGARPPAPSATADSSKVGISEEEKAAERLQKAYESLMQTMHQRITLFNQEGEAARVRYEIEHGALMALDPLLKQQAIARAQELDQMEKLREEGAARAAMAKEETDRIREGLEYGKEVLKDLEFERELIRLTNPERATAIQLRGMEAEAIAEYGDAIAEMNRKIEDSYNDVGFLDGMRNEFEDFFSSVINGNQSITDSFKNMLEGIASMITRRIAQNWVDQLFGEAGTSSSGSAGGWMQMLAGLFGGNRQSGGYAGQGHLFRVNEAGVEALRIPGREDYMLTAGRGGEVIPANRVGGGGGSVTNNFAFASPASTKTQTQMAARVSYEVRRAQRLGV